MKDAADALGLAMVAAELAGRYDVNESPVELASAALNHVQQPFKSQVDFFRDKLNLPTQAWTDIWHEQHDRSFVVAGAAHADLVDDLRGAVDSAIAEGTTLQVFRERFDAIVAKHGWSYRGGRNWRTRVIYDTNIRSSYSAGRYRQMKDIAERRPFWRYRHSHASENPRRQHLAWDGMVLRHDDPWWETNYPINGWGCKCYAEALNARDLERLGKSGPDQAPPLNMREVTVGVRGPSPRTVRVPDGIDPGFGYAPGRSTTRMAGLEDVIEKRFEHDPASYVQEGARIREELVNSAGGLESVGFEDRFRDGLLARLKSERGAGKAVSNIEVMKTRGGKAAPGTRGIQNLVKGVSKLLPESWIDAANKLPLHAYRRESRAYHGNFGDADDPFFVLVLNERPSWAWSDASTALHEYAHHLQFAMPEMNALFHRLHRKRTAGEPLVDVVDGYGEMGRKDKYVIEYYGREYEHSGGAANEVLTMAMEDMLFPRSPGRDNLRALAGAEGEDTEVLDLLLGVLFSYDP